MENKKIEFKAKIECSLLRGIFTTVSTLVDEVKLDIGEKKWVLKCVDPAHVAVMEIEVDVKNFEEYKCKVPGSIGIDVSRLLDAIKHTKDRDIIMIYTDTFKTTTKTDGKDVEIEVERIAINDGLCTRKTRMVDTSGMSESKLPNLELGTTFEMTWADFGNILKRLVSVSDHVTIKGSKDGIEFVAEGDMDVCNVKMPKDLLVSHKFSCETDKDKTEIFSLFPLDYLTEIFSNSKVKGMSALFKHERWLNLCKFQMDNQYPIKVEMERNGLRVLYLLVPRIESE